MNELEDAIDTIWSWFAWMPDWLISLALGVAAVVLALVAHEFLFRALRAATAERDLFWRSLVTRTDRVVLLALLVLTLAAAVNVAPLSPEGAFIASRMLLISLIGLAALALRTALNIWMTLHLRRFKLDADDNLLARKHVTQIRILRRVAGMLIFVVAFGAMLMTFEGVRQYGISLLASAGAAGIVAGLALQPLLKNLFAGIQLALTQPIRIDDALLVEGEWGKVEEITSTYVVIKIWDWRRLILPLSYFIEQPFQNWTREGAALIGSVLLYLDYRAPMPAIRAKVEEITRASPLWSGEVVSTQVIDCESSAIKVRILASARNGGATWDLRCELREKIIAFLHAEYPQALPRIRSEAGARPGDRVADDEATAAAVSEAGKAATGDA